MSDLSQFWMDQEIKKQGKLIAELRKAHDALKNQSTPYANGMRRMIKVREAIIELIDDGDFEVVNPTGVPEPTMDNRDGIGGSIVSNMKLKPCPFCGEIATIDSSLPDAWFVGCSTDDCRGNKYNARAYNRLSAVNSWNRRAPDAARATGGARAVDWSDPGHRLTETELDDAEKAYNDARRGRNGDAASCRAALEAVIRGFLASQASALPVASSQPSTPMAAASEILIGIIEAIDDGREDDAFDLIKEAKKKLGTNHV